MIDVVATVVLSIAALLATGASLFTSPFLLMATDSADENANLNPLGWAYAATGAGSRSVSSARHSVYSWLPETVG